MVEPTITQKPIKAIKIKDTLRVASPAIKPINGGPTKKPINPIVETAARATPGLMVLDFPAALYTIGTTEDTPAPTNRKPIMAV